MTFLNAALAFGAAACAVPFVIHLLNRNRFQVVPWGAMHLLEEIIRVNRRRVRLEQLVLLLIRMAIPVVLALVMAAPVLTGFNALSGDAKSSLVTLFDNSYSMEAGDDAGTNFERAKRQAAEIINQQPRGSDLSIVLMAGGKVGSSGRVTTDLEQSAKSLAALKAGFGGADVPAALESSARVLPHMQHAKRDVVIISDFQAGDWVGENAPARERALELINSQPLRPSVTLLHIDRAVIDNLCVRSLNISPEVVGIGEQIEIRANLHNYGDRLHPALAVYLRVDGKDEDSAEIELGSGEDGQVIFRHAFKSSGSHVIEVATDEADSLEADNRHLAAVQVWNRIPVLLVDGDPSDEPLKGETGFLQIALSPFVSAESNSVEPSGASPSADGSERAELLKVSTISTTELDSQTLDEHHVVVLANVAHLTDQQIEAVESFVRDGHALLVFPGNKIEANWYNNRLWKKGSGLLPLELQELETSMAESGSASDGRSAGVAIATEQFDHSAFTLFNDARNGDLAEGRIASWYRLGHFGESSRNVVVLARLDGEVPLFVEKKIGDGRVIQCATACDDAWSNLPARPFYLPMVQRLVTYLAGSVEPPRNVATGQTLAATLPADQAGQSSTLTAPTGEKVNLHVQKRGNRSFVEYAQTERTGLYTLEVPSGEVIHFVVDTPRAESDLTQLDDEQLQSLAKSMDATVVTSASEHLAFDSNRRYGREIWRPLFWILLLLVLGELLLEQLFTNQFNRPVGLPALVGRFRSALAGLGPRFAFGNRKLKTNPTPPAEAHSFEESPLDFEV